MEVVESNTEQKEIMPKDLFAHYVGGRNKAYATGGEGVYIPDNKIPGFKVFNWENPELPYHFEDHYTDSLELPGIFAGFEINRADSQEGKKLTFYIYNGNLTEDGLKLQEQTDEKLRNGEAAVYERLMHFLGKYTEHVRFGKTVTFEHEDGLGKWVYEGNGRIESNGWEDEESISLNGVQVYKLSGTGISFVAGK